MEQLRQIILKYHKLGKNNKKVTFRPTPFDGRYTNTALHNSIELRFYVQLWVFCFYTFQFDCN